MGSKSDQTSTQKTEPWAGQQPYLTDLFGQAQNLYQGGGPQYFPGQTVAPFSPQTQMGMDMTTMRALGGDPSMQGFGNYLTNTFNQQNMDPRQIAQYGQQGINQGAGMMQQAGQAGPSFGQAQNMFGVGSDIGLPGAAGFAGGATNPYTSALMGSSGYGGLGEASQFFGQGQGALPAASQYAQQALGQGPMGLGQGMQAAQGAIDPAAAQQLGATAGGSYLGSNPYLDQMYQTAADKVGQTFQEQIMPGIQGQFGAAGRTGSGAQALSTGKAAEGAAEQLRGLAGDIYAPAYESERGRQVQAAGQLGQLGLGAGGLGADIYGTAGQLGLGAGGLAGDIFGQQGQRLGMAADMYGQQRGLGQQAMAQAGQLGLGGGQLAADMYGTGLQGELARMGMAGEQYGGGLDRMLQAGQGVGQLGVAGMGGLTDLYGQTGQQQFRAGSLAPSYQGMQYNDIQQLMNMGAMTEDQAQRLIQGDMDRWNFQQNAPWANLGNYSNIINQLPGGYGTQTQTTPGGSRLSGAMGGAMAGSSMGPWGALGGGILGMLG